MSNTDVKPTKKLSLIRQEAQESLSKTIHSFFPAMEFLAEQECLYMNTPTNFTLDKTQQLTDLRATLFNAYATVFDIARNVETLGLDTSLLVSSVLESLNLEKSAVESHEGKAFGEIKHMSTFGSMSRVVDPKNPRRRNPAGMT